MKASIRCMKLDNPDESTSKSIDFNVKGKLCVINDLLKGVSSAMYEFKIRVSELHLASNTS